MQTDEAATAGFSGSKLQGQLLNLDPHLAETVANFELSPRIATVCLMYHLAATVNPSMASQPRLEDDVTAAGVMPSATVSTNTSKHYLHPCNDCNFSFEADQYITSHEGQDCIKQTGTNGVCV